MDFAQWSALLVILARERDHMLCMLCSLIAIEIMEEIKNLNSVKDLNAVLHVKPETARPCNRILQQNKVDLVK